MSFGIKAEVKNRLTADRRRCTPRKAEETKNRFWFNQEFKPLTSCLEAPTFGGVYPPLFGG